MRPNRQTRTCEWVNLRQALQAFVLNVEGHQGQSHIKPLHWYTACRLVIEGGFHPDDITPRPPFEVASRGRTHSLIHDPASARGGERTVLGGLKTKNVDVVVAKAGIGPCLAISHKGALKAFRNLTNRMEEAVGDCTNLHITYPALVYGYLVAIRANRTSDVSDAAIRKADLERSAGLESTADQEITTATANAAGSLLSSLDVGESESADIAMSEGGHAAAMIARFHQAMQELTGRRGIRDDVSRYEAVGVAMAEPAAANCGELLSTYPPDDSPLRFERFFSQLYVRYDERYVYGAPDLRTTTQRLEWSPQSPAFGESPAAALDYLPRLAASADV